MSLQSVYARAHIFVRGRVQGVGFRAWTAGRARSLSLCGWVKNRPDGDVEGVFEGSQDAVEEMLEALRVGPPAAHVEEVNISYGDYSGSFSGFEIQ